MLNALKNAWLMKHINAWDASVNYLNQLLAEEPDARDLLACYDDLREFAGNTFNAGEAYEVPTSIVEAVNFIGWFVGHEIKDDGSPVIAYYAKVVERTPEMPNVEHLRAKTHAPWVNVPAGTPNARVMLQRDPDGKILHRIPVTSVKQVVTIVREEKTREKALHAFFNKGQALNEIPQSEAAVFFTAYLG